MFRSLFHIYQRSPYPVRRAISKVSALPRLLARPFIKSVQVGGIRMMLNTADNAAFRYWNYGGNYEPGTTEVILRLISANPGCYFLDLGANYGAYTWAVANLGRYGVVKKIFAFEPAKICCDTMQESRRVNGLDDLVEIEQLIVGDYVGTAELLFSPNGSTNNRTFQNLDGEDGHTVFIRHTEQPCSTIDARMQAHGIDVRERFVIKMDIEGNEYRALCGMENLLTHSAGYAVMFEYWPKGIREAGLDPRDIRDFIVALKPDFILSEGPDFVTRRLASPEQMTQIMEAIDVEPVPGKAVGNFVFGSRVNLPASFSHLSRESPCIQCL